MPKQEFYEIYPSGWESDPLDERFKLSTLDYVSAQVFTAYAVFFKLADVNKPKAISTLKRGLEVTLSQCRQLCGVIEEHPDGGLCFHKKRDSTVQFHVQWLDDPEDNSKYPSFDELEKRHFVSQALGDMKTWCVDPMTYGEKPEAQPKNHPKVAAFKANFIPGGLVLVMHHHHYANDVMGWAGELHQLAENCAALWKSQETPKLPPWDSACLDLSRVTKPDPPEDQRINGPTTPPLRHPDHRAGQWLLFHLPKSKSEELKKLASPEDNSYWISSYDAYMAYIWRMLSKHRAKLFKADPKQKLEWGEAVDMRRRFHDPPVPERIQGNIVLGTSSDRSPIPRLTTEEVISEAPLSKLAWYIRQLTNSITQDSLDVMLTTIAPIRDKTSLFYRVDSLPPMSNFTSDWRRTNVPDADFGFAKPHVFRFPFDTVTAGLSIVQPVRTVDPPSGEDEGNEFLVSFEKEISKDLIEDPEWNKYFEFRGVEYQESG
ncbi:transferase family-domain-containing protein [Daldinia vernicosa]|uniref:transferase family-domain-containing protein n=1 Tax=Daldinia vernicosa TaxID=114800 RepID=UPI0020074D81|nr:transferase family-domain-containing protein [Daldinia vernicosa]KAI0847425.1 transferase family-domain-containing protein [Daldinia vernicosa]